MFVFVYGGRNSGKSEYAEKRACELSDKRIYLATMKIMDEEGEKRVARHRAMRAGKGFATIECESNINELDLDAYEPLDCVLLLECVSNLLGNEMFNGQTIRSVEDTVAVTLNEINKVVNKVGHIVVVSSEYEDWEISPDEDTMNYLRALNMVNEELKEMADEVHYKDF